MTVTGAPDVLATVNVCEPGNGMVVARPPPNVMVCARIVKLCDVETGRYVALPANEAAMV